MSGKENLAFNGQVDTTAIKGNVGTLLLDPENITVSDDPSNPAPEVDDSLPEIGVGEFDGQNITVDYYYF